MTLQAQDAASANAAAAAATFRSLIHGHVASTSILDGPGRVMAGYDAAQPRSEHAVLAAGGRYAGTVSPAPAWLAHGAAAPAASAAHPMPLPASKPALLQPPAALNPHLPAAGAFQSRMGAEAAGAPSGAPAANTLSAAIASLESSGSLSAPPPASQGGFLAFSLPPSSGLR